MNKHYLFALRSANRIFDCHDHGAVIAKSKPRGEYRRASPEENLPHLLAIAGFVALSADGAQAQQATDGKGKTCSSAAARCYTMGGGHATCEPNLQQRLQTGAFDGARHTVVNLTRK